MASRAARTTAGAAAEKKLTSDTTQEITMKTVLAALAVTLAIASTAIPASANYVAPDASWQTKALAGTGY